MPIWLTNTESDWYNPEYNVRNNSSSIYAVREYLRNSYICSSDNYFTKNPFEPEAEDAYYSAVYADGQTAEWCMETGDDGYINRVHIGGCDAWYMLGHVFWNEKFTDSFLRILTREYDREDTAAKLWETIYAEHLGELRLRMRKYAPGVIFEFDSLDELRHFDTSYISDTRSRIIACIADKLNCPQAEFDHFDVLKAESGNEAIGFSFRRGGDAYRYIYETKTLTKV